MAKPAQGGANPADPNRGQDAGTKRDLLGGFEIAGNILDRSELCYHVPKLRQDELAEGRQVCACPVAMKERASHFGFQLFDGSGKGWLRNVAPLGSSSKVAALGQ
ncbi:MAG: hypothetical protein AAF449_12805, partial [Myxococcota bacterium]